MNIQVAAPGSKVAVTALLIALLAVGFATLLPSSVSASSGPYIARSTSISCVYTVSPCGTTLSVVLPVTQADTLVVWTSYYPRCSTPESISPSDSAGDVYSPIGNNGFQFAACTPPGALALDSQSAYYSTARSSTTVTVTMSYTTAPYEADLIVDDVSGGSYVGYEVALCNGSEASQCMPNGGASFGVSSFVAPSNSIIIAYGSASSDSTVIENPLSAGPGYATDQGPVYPGGYMLDSLTEYSTATGPTTAPMETSTPTDGWGEIAIVLSAMSLVTVTVTQTEMLIQNQTVMVTEVPTTTVTQTANQVVPVTTTTTLSTTVTSTSTASNFVPGITNDTLVLAIALILAALIVSITLMRISTRKA